MPSTDHPTNNDILISFDPLISDNGTAALDYNRTESTNTLSVDHVKAVLEDGSLAQLTMGDLQSLPASQRYCHIEDTYYILPNYIANENIETSDIKVATPIIEKTSFMSRLKTKFRSSASDQPRHLFGIPLDALSPFPPPFLAIAFTCILQHPLEGVYRLSAAVSAVTKATNLLNTNPSDSDFLRMVDEDQAPILAAALIKAFIRQIPGGLLFNNHTLLADAINEFTGHSNENKLLTLLHSLPHRNAIIARQLFDHLNTLLAFSESTKMTSANLATCMGPNLFCDFTTLQDRGKNSMDAAMAMTQLGTSLAKWLISDAHRVFDQLPTSHYIAVILKRNDRVEWIDYGDAKAMENPEDMLLVQQFPLFTKPFDKRAKGRIENVGGYYMNDLIEIDPFADCDRPPQAFKDDEEGEELSEMNHEQDGSSDESVETESEDFREDAGENDIQFDSIEERTHETNLSDSSSRENQLEDDFIEKQQGVFQRDSETEPNPWEGSSIPTIVPFRSASLEELQSFSPNHESDDEITTMSEPGQPSTPERSPTASMTIRRLVNDL